MDHPELRASDYAVVDKPKRKPKRKALTFRPTAEVHELLKASALENGRSLNEEMNHQLLRASDRATIYGDLMVIIRQELREHRRALGQSHPMVL